MKNEEIDFITDFEKFITDFKNYQIMNFPEFIYKNIIFKRVRLKKREPKKQISVWNLKGSKIFES